MRRVLVWVALLSVAASLTTVGAAEGPDESGDAVGESAPDDQAPSFVPLVVVAGVAYALHRAIMPRPA